MESKKRTPRCKAAQKRYRQTEKGKVTNLKSVKKYRKTSKGKATQKRYKQTEKGKAANKRYSQSKKGKTKERRLYAHLSIRSYLKRVFRNMLYRCNNPENKSYKYYGDRGIKVKFTSFEDFYDYVVNELKADPRGLTIDRINNKGNYESGNIRFVSQAENKQNKN